MKRYYEYIEEYNVDPYIKKNTITYIIDFDSVMVIEYRKINNPITAEKPFLMILLKNGNTFNLPLSEAERFISKYKEYAQIRRPDNG